MNGRGIHQFDTVERLSGALLNLQIAVGRLMATHSERNAILADMQEHISNLRADAARITKTDGNAEAILAGLADGAEENFQEVQGIMADNENVSHR